MAPLPLRIVQDTAPTGDVSAPPRGGRLGALLLGSGQITPAALHLALADQAQTAAPLGAILCNRGDLSETALFDALALQFGTVRIDPSDHLPDRRLIDRLGAQFCAVHGVLPIALAGAVTLIATSEPQKFHMIRPVLEQHFGDVAMVLCTRPDLHHALCSNRKRHLAHAAEHRTADHESCRSMSPPKLIWGGLALSATIGAGLMLAPEAMMTLLIIFALLILLVNTVFTALMGGAWLVAQRKKPVLRAENSAQRPVSISLIVPLFKERQIAEHLVQRLALLEYPAEQLEILLVVEEDDAVTRATLAACDPLPHMRILTVPRGGIQTKPRAMNYALDFCRGSIVGVYDAEDAPDRGQLRAVVRQFARSAPQVACLQGQLDYYNPGSNWMARCFTVEYATWFRVMLPGMARLGLALPLGGTTLFFRKSALAALGGWDAHNVTEDADLGLRLTRWGYRTDILDSVTHEEANCRAWPWVRQRSRWIKGYAITYLVHMRHPVALWRDLGARRFWGMQALFLGGILGVLTAPLLWAFALLMLGLPHPWATHLGAAGGTALAVCFTGITLVHWSVWAMGVWARGDKGLLAWVPTLSLYHTLATAAALKAVFELVTCPFFWDKTSHGHMGQPPVPSRRALTTVGEV